MPPSLPISSPSDLVLSLPPPEQTSSPAPLGARPYLALAMLWRERRRDRPTRTRTLTHSDHSALPRCLSGDPGRARLCADPHVFSDCRRVTPCSTTCRRASSSRPRHWCSSAWYAARRAATRATPATSAATRPAALCTCASSVSTAVPAPLPPQAASAGCELAAGRRFPASPRTGLF